MTNKIEQRRIADNTREKILKAAEKLFAAKGFSGTSTAAIAKAAKVNEALLFHHFGNKAKLWQQVKANIIEHLPNLNINPTPNTLEDFLKEAIDQRILSYQSQPNLLRIMRWQSLEEDKTYLAGGNKLAPLQWLPAIEYLQQQEKINANTPAEMIMLWLTYSINALIYDDLALLQDQQKQERFIQMLMVGFKKALS
ncbi:MAG: putative transcriptional regulator, TetR family [Rickettsiaceae bacterium]|nr:putative transcriptional regulator, TetR family [Rickettsiaceae bacterium]